MSVEVCICNDDRFKLINKAKTKLLETTNIETRPDEMVVIDDILFRCWQMGWLDQLREDKIEIVRYKNCKWFIPQGTHHFNGGVTNKNTCKVVRGYIVQIEPDDFCKWGERKDFGGQQ